MKRLCLELSHQSSSSKVTVLLPQPFWLSFSRRPMTSGGSCSSLPPHCRVVGVHASSFFFLFTLTGYSLQFPCLTFPLGSRENEYKCSYFQRGECTEKGTMETRWHCASTLKASSLIHNSHSVSAGIGSCDSVAGVGYRVFQPLTCSNRPLLLHLQSKSKNY